MTRWYLCLMGCNKFRTRFMAAGPTARSVADYAEAELGRKLTFINYLWNEATQDRDERPTEPEDMIEGTTNNDDDSRYRVEITFEEFGDIYERMTAQDLPESCTCCANLVIYGVPEDLVLTYENLPYEI